MKKISDPKKAKADFLDNIKKKYLLPASKELKEGIKKGILPKNCMVLWSNNTTIEILSNAKNI